MSIDAEYLLKGMVIGFSIAAPIGPIGVMCFRRALVEGSLAGFVSGLGAATADAVYGAVAALGLTAVSAFLLSQAAWLKLAGAVFLMGLGLKFFLSGWNGTRPETAQGRADPGYGAYLQTFALTIANPMTILLFIAVFAGAGLGQATAGNAASGTLLVLGVFLGSALWWLALSGLAQTLRSRLTLGRLAWVNKLSGASLTGIGLASLLGQAW